ncbi:BTAD domain-containing putative transcriptional regulator [Spirillospora sp. CA-294931]|uniref:BTAD domain-containing putative transcriptional regulator n=1 Tax=Spirillospora sp. CA-294931 TaxID=3240042 RepID=UPI003D8A0235
MRFGVLGPVEARTDGGAPVRVRDLKVRTLLAALLAGGGRLVPADRLIDELWGSSLPANPTATLQARASQLRRAFEDAEPGARSLLVSRPPGYVLQSTDVDAQRFGDLLESARAASDPETRTTLLTQALDLWRGPAYADFADAAFAVPEVARLEEARLAALEERAEARLESGVPDTVELAGLVARHPARERLRAVYMRTLYRAGRQTEALQSFEELRLHLRDELGLDPGPALAALQRSILVHDPALNGARALVGRGRAVDELSALLESSRLVTLVGPGGVGKTSLALETARAYPGEVRTVEFTGPDVLATLNAALGLRDAPDPVAHLSGRRALLVLDNCEHVVEPAADLAARLLREVPDLRVLATSREPLNLRDERLWPVPPLDVPPPATEHSELRGYGAVQLLLARSPGLTPAPGNAGAIATICRRLDGIPLALELAATRLRGMSVHELADRLDDRFRLLSLGPRDAPARQRTLRAMIDWSWEPLSAPERAVLRRLAVHTGGCTLEAAERVCAEPGTLDLLTRLVDRSLVVHANGRYRLLESVAAYCLERLDEAGERARVVQRGASYYLDLAERAAPRLRSHDQRRWLDRLDAEAANLRSAVETLPPEPALRLVNALGWYWYLNGSMSEAIKAFTHALSHTTAPQVLRAEANVWLTGLSLLADTGHDREHRVRSALDGTKDPWAAWFLGYARRGFGDGPAIDALMERALAGFGEDAWGAAAALGTRAGQAMARGDLPAAERDGRRSLRLFEDLGDRWGQLRAIDVLGTRAEAIGAHAEAADLHRRGLRLAEELGLWPEISSQLTRLGRIALLTGDHARATDFHERARDLAAAHADRRLEHFAEIGLALGARRRGDLDAAESTLLKWVEWCRQIDGAPGLALVLAELGFVAEQRGDAARALALHTEGLAAARATGNPRATALAQEGLAGALSLQGDLAKARRHLAAATRARDSAGAPLPPAERHDISRIQARLNAG